MATSEVAVCSRRWQRVSGAVRAVPVVLSACALLLAAPRVFAQGAEAKPPAPDAAKAAATKAGAAAVKPGTPKAAGKTVVETAPRPEPAAEAAPPVAKAKAKERQRPTLPLSPTREELREIERRRAAAADGVDPPTKRPLPTQTGDTSGPAGRAGAGTSQDRKQSVLEGIGPTEGGVRR